MLKVFVALSLIGLNTYANPSKQKKERTPAYLGIGNCTVNAPNKEVKLTLSDLKQIGAESLQVGTDPKKKCPLFFSYDANTIEPKAMYPQPTVLVYSLKSFESGICLYSFSERNLLSCRVSE